MHTAAQGSAGPVMLSIQGRGPGKKKHRSFKSRIQSRQVEGFQKEPASQPGET